MQIFFDDWLLGSTLQRIITNVEGILSSPLSELSFSEIEERDGGLVFDSRYSSKKVRIRGEILAPSLSGFLGIIDELKKNLSKPEGKLKIGIGNIEREWDAGLEGEVKIEQEPWDVTHAFFEANFLIPDPFAYDPFETTWSGTSITGLFSTINLTFSGTADPLPKINYIAVNSGNLTGVEFINDTTKDRIFVDLLNTRYANQDILTIDCKEKKVAVNTLEVPFSGMFPTFALGVNTLKTNFTAASAVRDKRQTISTDSYPVFYTRPKLAQGFSPSVSGKLTQVTLHLMRDLDPGTVTVQICSGTSDAPSTTVLASASFAGSTLLKGVKKWIDVVFLNPPNVTAGNWYWIVLTAANLDLNLAWGGTNSSSDYKARAEEAGSWVTLAPSTIKDFAYITYILVTNPTYKVNWEVRYKRRWR